VVWYEHCNAVRKEPSNGLVHSVKIDSDVVAAVLFQLTATVTEMAK